MHTMFEMQERSALRTREKLQDDLVTVKKMDSLPIFGVGRLPPVKELMEERESVLSLKQWGGRVVQEAEESNGIMGHDKFFSKERICNLSPGGSLDFDCHRGLR